MKKIVIPEEMVKAVMNDPMVVSVHDGKGQFLTYLVALEVLKRGMLWLSKNPIVPTREQWNRLWTDCCSGALCDSNYKLVSEWQRRMFFELEPEVPLDVEDLLIPSFLSSVEIITGESNTRTEAKYRDAVVESFRRGQKSKEAK